MKSKKIAHKKISELVERFTLHFDSYKNSDYNETLTRRDFIDPFFKNNFSQPHNLTMAEERFVVR